VAFSLSKFLEDHLGSIIVGPPQFDRLGRVSNMVVYPLFPDSLDPHPSPLITLSEAMRRGVNLQDTGLVNRVHVDNPLPASVLAGESDVLLGPTQLRSMQYSCLVPPYCRASLPVNCVEEGQPTQYQARFTQSSACPWYVRSFKMEKLARSGEIPQFEVWEKVKSYLDMAGTVSSTHDLHAVLNDKAFEMHNLSDLFPRRPGQIGTISAVGHDLFVELYTDPEILEDRYDSVLRSALVDAVTQSGVNVVSPSRVKTVLAEIAEASKNNLVLQSRSLRSAGRSLAFTGNGVSGTALLSGDNLVHLSAHQRCWGQDEHFDTVRDELESACDTWASEHNGFLRNLASDYAARRTRYNEFKSRLTSDSNAGFESEYVAPPTGEEEETTSLRPMPLSPHIHNFFLGLFRS
jgi:hypothetical protein